MKIDLVVFVNPAQSLATGSTAPSFSSADEGGKYRDAGFKLEATPFGVAAEHPKVPGIIRIIPWSNVKWVDTNAEAVRATKAPKAAPASAKEHWKTRQKRERLVDVGKTVAQAGFNITHSLDPVRQEP